MNDLQGNILNLLFALPAFVIAFTVHEFAHAWAAVKLGDETPRRLGRLTLDPVAHLDPFGSIMFVLTQLVGFGLGWAKPVPFNPRNMANPRRDTMLVAIAGPISNILQVPIWFGLLFAFRLAAEHMKWDDGGFGATITPTLAIYEILQKGIVVNIVLAAFNMFPFPPLDGHYVLEGLGPPFVADFFESIRPYSFMLLLAMSYFHIFGYVIRPFGEFAYRLVNVALGGSFS